MQVFLNFTSPDAAAFRPDPDVVCSTQLNVGLVEAFGRNGYTPAELARFLADGGQALSITEGGQPVAVGMIYRNFEHIWEIAALFTHPSARRKGYAARIVRTALHTLHQHGYTPRYVVDSANAPSSKLAETVGLKRFLTVIHYAASGRSAMDAPRMYGSDKLGQTRENPGSDSNQPHALPQCGGDEGKSGGSLSQVAGLIADYSGESHGRANELRHLC